MDIFFFGDWGKGGGLRGVGWEGVGLIENRGKGGYLRRRRRWEMTPGGISVGKGTKYSFSGPKFPLRVLKSQIHRISH